VFGTPGVTVEPVPPVPVVPVPPVFGMPGFEVPVPPVDGEPLLLTTQFPLLST
jgi:hypothetical protein